MLSAKRAESRRKQGICATCGRGKVWREGATRCRRCLARDTRGNAGRKTALRAAGICVCCGLRPSWRAGAVHCVVCRESWNTRRREARKANQNGVGNVR